jgi:hypothetical protein
VTVRDARGRFLKPTATTIPPQPDPPPPGPYKPPTWLVWVVVVVIVLVVLVLVLAAYAATLQHAISRFSGTQAPGTKHYDPVFYNWWSGPGSDLGEVTLVVAIIVPSVALVKRMNCGQKGCWRVGTHEYEMDGVKHHLCRTHHPLIPDGKPVTAAQILDHHRRTR